MAAAALYIAEHAPFMTGSNLVIDGGMTVQLQDSHSQRVAHFVEEFRKTSGIDLSKDRMALHVIRRAYQEGAIRFGDTIAEATSGKVRGEDVECPGRG